MLGLVCVDVFIFKPPLEFALIVWLHQKQGDSSFASRRGFLVALGMPHTLRMQHGDQCNRLRANDLEVPPVLNSEEFLFDQENRVNLRTRTRLRD